MSTKSFKVEQLKWNDGKVRTVEVPYSELMGDVDYDLNKIFHYGQNDFQPKDSASVSVGDIIEWTNGDKHIVCGMGFEKLTDELYQLLTESVQESIEGGRIGVHKYSDILWKKLGKESFKYC